MDPENEPHLDILVAWIAEKLDGVDSLIKEITQDIDYSDS